jgi:hypothetical protein
MANITGVFNVPSLLLLDKLEITITSAFDDLFYGCLGGALPRPSPDF